MATVRGQLYAIPIGSSVVPCLGLPYRILNITPPPKKKKELQWSLWVFTDVHGTLTAR